MKKSRISAFEVVDEGTLRRAASGHAPSIAAAMRAARPVLQSLRSWGRIARLLEVGAFEWDDLESVAAMAVLASIRSGAAHRAQASAGYFCSVGACRIYDHCRTHGPFGRVSAQVLAAYGAAVEESISRGVPMDVERFAAAHGVAPSVVERIAAHRAPVVRLDAPLGPGSAETHEIIDSQTQDARAIVERDEAAAALRGIVGCLDDEDRRVIEWRFGLDCEPMSLPEIGRKLGCTTQNASLLVGRALGSLRKKLALEKNRRFGSALSA